MENTKKPTKKKKKKRKLKKSFRILRAIYIIVVIVAALVVLGYGATKLFFREPEIPADNSNNSSTEQAVAPGMEDGTHQRKEQTYTFMLAVPDQESGNADSIMVVTYDVPNQKVGMLSIPRDTLVNKKNPKINSSMAAGIDNLESVVSELVGFPIDYYVTLDLNAFIEIVDAVGGVDFDVPVEMYYDDPAQDLHIHYMPGMQHLSGQQAMEVCRFRHNADGTGYPLGDVQRAETAQRMMLTVAKKVMSLDGLVNINEFVNIVERNIETDLKGTGIAWFAAKALGLNLSTGVAAGALPGDGNVSYRGTSYCYELYPEDSLALINSLVNPYVEPLTLSDVVIFQAP
ncbi:MAG: LCP family protein [Ruminiclostridium sp.]|nr:LCP family protein [Ruminiclostridium sp.]